MAAAPAAPVVVEGGALAAITGALILALLTWAMLFGLQQTYTYTFGALLHGLAVVLDKVPLIDLGSRTVGQIDDFVQEQLGRALSAAEANVSRTWYALGYVARLTAQTVELLASSTLDAIHALVRVEIPAQIRANTLPAVTRLGLATASLALAVAKVRLDLAARAVELERDLARDFGRAWQGIDALRRDAIPALRTYAGGIAADLGKLSDYAHKGLNHRLTRVEKAVGGTALAAAVLTTVARFAPWVRCSNVNRVGKAACRMDHDLLESLLAGSLVIAGSLSLAQMARELREPTALVMDGVASLVREL